MRLLLLVLLINLNALAQGYQPVGARSLAMGGASVTLTDVWGFNNNPGALAYLNTTEAGAFYGNQYALQEFQVQGLALAHPIKVGVLSLGGTYSGSRVYQDLKFGGGYSMKLSELLYAGVQLNYHQLNLGSNYGNKQSLTGELGMLAFITEQWRVGFSVMNFGRTKLSGYQDDRWSSVMRLGTSYSFSKKVITSFEMEKDLDRPLVAKAGAEYFVVDALCLRGGVATGEAQFFFGLGYQQKWLRLDVGSGYHQILGWSPFIGIAYAKQAKE